MSSGYLQIIGQLLGKVVVDGGEQQVVRWPGRVEAGRTTFPGVVVVVIMRMVKEVDTVSLRFLRRLNPRSLFLNGGTCF